MTTESIIRIASNMARDSGKPVYIYECGKALRFGHVVPDGCYPLERISFGDSK